MYIYIASREKRILCASSKRSTGFKRTLLVCILARGIQTGADLEVPIQKAVEGEELKHVRGESTDRAILDRDESAVILYGRCVEGEREVRVV